MPFYGGRAVILAHRESTRTIRNVLANSVSEPFKTASTVGGGIGVAETAISQTPEKPAYWYRGFDGVDRGCTPGTSVCCGASNVCALAAGSKTYHLCRPRTL